MGVDDCWLKSLTKGELLVGIFGRDENNQMSSLAWVLVELECTSLWMWFLGRLIEEINFSERRG